MVAERLGFKHDEALSLGNAPPGLNARLETGEVIQILGVPEGEL